MKTTVAQSRDLIAAAIQDVADELGIDRDLIFYDDVRNTRDRFNEESTNPPKENKSHLRVTIRPTTGRQVSVTSGQQNTGRFRHSGIVGIQIMTPMGDGSTTGDEYAQAFLDGLEGLDSGAVTYDNVGVSHRGRIDQWYEQRVVADYHYDSTK